MMSCSIIKSPIQHIAGHSGYDLPSQSLDWYKTLYHHLIDDIIKHIYQEQRKRITTIRENERKQTDTN